MISRWRYASETESLQTLGLPGVTIGEEKVSLNRAARSSLLVGAFLLVLALVLVGCGGGGGQENKGEKGGGQGQITVQGSSTVLPISQAAAEAFNQQNRDVEITVG